MITKRVNEITVELSDKEVESIDNVINLIDSLLIEMETNGLTCVNCGACSYTGDNLSSVSDVLETLTMIRSIRKW